MARKCIIVSGGEFHPILNIQSADFLIACDRGYEYARRSGLTPDLVISDFDSYSGTVAEGIPIRRLPCEKDDTDTMSAIRYACAEGYAEIELHCALGGRLDHTLANLQALVWATHHGVVASIVSPDTEIRALQAATLRLTRREGFSLSVFAMTDRCRVTIRGTKYELFDTEITNAFPIGVSNEWDAAEAEVTAHEGTLLIVESRIR